MTVTLDKSHELTGNGYLLGVGGENESEQLIINIAYDVLLDKWPYIEFEQNGAKFTTERLTIANGQIVYTLTNSVLVQGHLDIQVVFRDASGFVWKSFKRQFLVSDEINATENLPEQHPDFIAKAQAVLDEIAVESDKVDEVLATEATRVADEAERAENEATRLANETERETTEAERKTAETARVAAEAQRQISEVGRVDAETARRTEFSGWANSLGNLNTYDKRLINLEEASVGTLFDYVTDDTTAYSKAVPARALPYARLIRVGGMTYKANNALTDTPVKSVGGYAIPEAVRLLDGYGIGIDETTYNYIDLENKKLIEKVKRVLLNGDENWRYEPELARFYIHNACTVPSVEYKGITSNTSIPYTNKVLGGGAKNGILVFASGTIFLRNTNYTDLDNFKTWLRNNPITLIYEIATPIETDISAYITDNYIKVNGSIVFESDTGAAVPSEIIYAVKR